LQAHQRKTSQWINYKLLIEKQFKIYQIDDILHNILYLATYPNIVGHWSGNDYGGKCFSTPGKIQGI